jgi:hypothetical protein
VTLEKGEKIFQGFLTGERMAFVSVHAFARDDIFVGIKTIRFFEE